MNEMMPYYVGQDPRAAKIAILGLEVVGAVDLESVRVARELTTALRLRAAEGPYTIAPNSDRELIDEKVMHNCPDERKECMAKIGRALNAEYLLYGRVERRPRGDYQISLRLLDVNGSYLASWTDLSPGAESSGAKLAQRGRAGYERLIAGIRPRDERPVVADNVLIHATNEAFWQITRYKPGQRLDMSLPQDRAMSKRWLDIYRELRGHRDRATQTALRTLNETVTPYVLVLERKDGSLSPHAFPGRNQLDVQYTWIVDQPEDWTYVAAFDFTQRRDAPLYDQFALTVRRREATSGWYGW